jgi:hypothetical protein
VAATGVGGTVVVVVVGVDETSLFGGVLDDVLVFDGTDVGVVELADEGEPVLPAGVDPPLASLDGTVVGVDSDVPGAFVGVGKVGVVELGCTTGTGLTGARTSLMTCEGVSTAWGDAVTARVTTPTPVQLRAVAIAVAPVQAARPQGVTPRIFQFFQRRRGAGLRRP